jgi:hypothetical protein
MGVYAETSGAHILCDKKTTANKVMKVLREQSKKSDDNGNNFATNIHGNGTGFFFQVSSNRVQNLEWQCEQIWDAVENIKGVEAMNVPILVESEGYYFSNKQT